MLEWANVPVTKPIHYFHIKGIRLPDDESDRVTWRNGRVINNIFFPDNPSEPTGNSDSIPNKYRKKRRMPVANAAQAQPFRQRQGKAADPEFDLIALESQVNM